MPPLARVMTEIQNKQDRIQMACNAHGPYGTPKPLAMVDKTLAPRLAKLIIRSCESFPHYKRLEKALDIVRRMPIDYIGKWRFDVPSMTWEDVMSK